MFDDIGLYLRTLGLCWIVLDFKLRVRCCSSSVWWRRCKHNLNGWWVMAGWRAIDTWWWLVVVAVIHWYMMIMMIMMMGGGGGTQGAADQPVKGVLDRFWGNVFIFFYRSFTTCWLMNTDSRLLAHGYRFMALLVHVFWFRMLVHDFRLWAVFLTLMIHDCSWLLVYDWWLRNVSLWLLVYSGWFVPVDLWLLVYGIWFVTVDYCWSLCNCWLMTID